MVHDVDRRPGRCRAARGRQSRWRGVLRACVFVAFPGAEIPVVYDVDKGAIEKLAAAYKSMDAQIDYEACRRAQLNAVVA